MMSLGPECVLTEQTPGNSFWGCGPGSVIRPLERQLCCFFVDLILMFVDVLLICYGLVVDLLCIFIF